MNCRYLIGLLVSLLALCNSVEASEYKNFGRYYLEKQSITAEQKDPLKQQVQIVFPSSVQTIESAYRYLLAPTGYELADLLVIDKKFIVLSSKSLPISQRMINGKVIELLHLLAGDDFVVVRDDFLRLIAVDAKVGRNER